MNLIIIYRHFNFFFFFFFSLGYRGEKDPQVLRFTPPTPWLFFRLYSLIITTSFVTAAAGVLSPLKSSFIHFKREARRRSPDNDFREKSFFFFFLNWLTLTPTRGSMTALAIPKLRVVMMNEVVVEHRFLSMANSTEKKKKRICSNHCNTHNLTGSGVINCKSLNYSIPVCRRMA